VITRNTLGEFLAAELHKQGMSNRALAASAGVSESVIRNLLQHGLEPKAKDPDPRTLRAVADTLGINALVLFRLAGYIPPPPDALSVRGQFVGEAFDRLQPEKQDAVMGVIQALTDRQRDKDTLHDIRTDAGNPLAGFDIGSTRLIRSAANRLIAGANITDAVELDEPNRIPLDLEVFHGGLTWSAVPESTKRRVIGLAKAKLNLDYDPTMVDPQWRK
jgi:transcriptional regulator with XRE-family HTH domain